MIVLEYSLSGVFRVNFTFTIWEDTVEGVAQLVDYPGRNSSCVVSVQEIDILWTKYVKNLIPMLGVRRFRTVLEGR